MKTLNLLLIFIVLSCFKTHAQAPKIVYAELGGPGLFSVNFDTRFSNREDGIGGRAGIGGFWIKDDYDSKASILTIPVGLNYLLGKDGKNYFEVGAGYTIITGKASSEDDSETFGSSFGNLTLGYRMAPARGGFTFKAQITPVFGNGFFIPYFFGIGFGYKF